MLGFPSVICQCRHLPVLTLSGQEYRSFTRRRRSPIYASSQRPGLNERSKPLYAQGRASSAAYWKSVGLRLLPTEHVLGVWSFLSDVSSGRIRGDGPLRGRRTQCPDKASRVLPVHTSRRRPSRSSMAITMKKKCLSAVYQRALSPHQLTTPRRERIAFLNSARSAWRSTRLAPNRRLANRIAFSHVLSSAHRLQVYLGRQRLNVPAIKHVEGSGNQGPPKRARQPIRWEAAMRRVTWPYLE